MRTIFFTGIMSCFSFLVSYAQPVIKTSIDKNEVLIGDQFKLTIEAGFSPESHLITWPIVPDTLPHFEVISRGKIDSLYSNNKLSGLVQILTLTSFDSGKWILPSFQVNFVPVKAGDPAYNFFTDSVPVTVSFSTSDTTSRLRDIKPIMEAETINPVWYVIVAGMLLIALIIFLIWFYRYWKRNKASIPFQTKTSPYEEAVKELESLKAYNLSLPVEIKIVHSKLAAILKRYLSRSKKTDFQNKTTGDILIWLSDQNGDKNLLAKAAASLRCCDAVKFAKYLPPVTESETCLQSIREVITNLQKQAETQKSKI